jgi:hypothetical protein
MVNLVPDNDSKIGTYLVSDSKDIPKIMQSFEMGLNGLIVYSRKYYERHLVIEFRSETELTNFTNGLDENDGGLINYAGQVYYYQDMNLNEQHGGSGSLDNPMWTFTIDLVRE